MKIEGSAYGSASISGSGSISQRHGSADPDTHQNVMDSEHCFRGCESVSKGYVSIVKIESTFRGHNRDLRAKEIL
jgi:hypothetical protein